MRVLLDTHAFIWWDREPNRIPLSTLLMMQESELILSLVSLWEIQIKTHLGKLNLGMPLNELIRHHKGNGIHLLPITVEHILNLDHLPNHHKDPFDRLLISQSIVERIPIITQDSMFVHYDCQIFWES
ncbi:MAG: type II toxin-antitoxin system VapC family toxin [Synechococcaceae cyanobacterium SM2_3_2]|nr:type II toxin-antitoxin system VapC family toxin [Synechococcaceae cyanobacterium SM2_3_2]